MRTATGDAALVESDRPSDLHSSNVGDRGDPSLERRKYAVLQRHAARGATDARAMQANLDDSVVHAHNLHIAAIGLDVRPQQVNHLADFREDRIVRLSRARRTHVTECRLVEVRQRARPALWRPRGPSRP